MRSHNNVTYTSQMLSRTGISSIVVISFAFENCTRISNFRPKVFCPIFPLCHCNMHLPQHMCVMGTKCAKIYEQSKRIFEVIWFGCRCSFSGTLFSKFIYVQIYMQHLFCFDVCWSKMQRNFFPIQNLHESMSKLLLILEEKKINIQSKLIPQYILLVKRHIRNVLEMLTFWKNDRIYMSNHSGSEFKFKFFYRLFCVYWFIYVWAENTSRMLRKSTNENE